MEDLLLSDIKRSCKGKDGCHRCQVIESCPIWNGVPFEWDIKDYNKVSTPYKEERVNTYGTYWDVYYREANSEINKRKEFKSEAEADAFIAKLTGGK